MKQLSHIIAVASLFVFSCGYSKDHPEYDVANIAPALRENADAVVRQQITQIEIINEKEASIKERYVVTIFNSKEKNWGVLVLGYDKSRIIEELDGAIYNSEGVKIRSLKSSDIEDRSAFSYYNLYEDSRKKIASLYNDQYPYTVEFTYEIKLNGYLGFSPWLARTSEQPVEYSRFEVQLPKGKTLRYWCSKDSVSPSVREEKKYIYYTWEARSLPYISKDALNDDVEDFTAVVRIAPDDFEYEGYRGNMSTWQNIGLWNYNLWKGRDVLPDDSWKEVSPLLGKAQSRRDTIQILYRYLQTTTRYVSVQWGIGGHQPFDASYVYKNKYGDCKALSNFMIALLKKAGITAYPAAIRSGNYRYTAIPDFPCEMFNHMIVCVPSSTDTLWLECTSSTLPMGTLGAGNEDHYALLITPEGGKLVKTPCSSYLENKQVRIAKVNLLATGDSEVSTTIQYTGNQLVNIRSNFHYSSQKEQQEFFLSQFNLPHAAINSLSFYGMEPESTQFVITTTLTLHKAASRSGDRLFFRPNIFEQETYTPKSNIQRLSPIRLHYAYLDVDSCIISLPPYFTIESLPKEILIEAPFGKYYTKTVSLNDISILYVRKKEMRERVIPADQYEDYCKFYREIVKADRAQIVLKWQGFK